MMYDLHVDAPTLAVIRAQSAKLAAQSASLAMWNSGPYARCLRLINSETAEALRRLWTLYSGTEYQKPSFLAAYNKAIKKTDGELQVLEDAKDPLTQTYKQFWSSGPRGNSGTNRNICNPLFAYTRLAGARFAVDKDSNPLAGFHIVTAFANVDRQYLLYPMNGPDSRNDLRQLAINAFRLQFDASCDSFKRLVKSAPRRLRIRVFAGDEIAFCMGLRQLRDPKYTANCYSRPGSTMALVLDGEKHPPQSGDRTPAKFNVIETDYLIDRIGLLNLLPNVIDALESPTSVLYTSTRVEKAEDEVNLLEKYLCGDVSTMCALLGVVPSAYLCGHAFQAFEEYHDLRPAENRPLTSRIVWVPTTSTDPNVDLGCARIRCDLHEMVLLLATVYGKMFGFKKDEESPRDQWYKYTIRSFVSLLAFLKTRVLLNWRKCSSQIMQVIHDDETTHQLICQYRHEFVCELDYCSLLPLATNFRRIDNISSDYLVFILTVPRSTLQPIYGKLASKSLPIAFRMYVQPRAVRPVTEHRWITSVHHCFGKWSSTDKYNATIIEDPAAWHGNSDLHVWAFVTPGMIEGEGANSLDVGLALTPEKGVEALFRSALGDILSVFKVTVPLARAEHALLKMRPEPPKLKKHSLCALPFGDVFPASEVAKSTRSSLVKFPVLDVENQRFITRIDISGDALKIFQNKEMVSVQQSSTCTLTAKFGLFRVECNYTFPVDYNTTKLRVSRVQGWIDVAAPLLTPSRRGPLSSNPFPVVLSGSNPQVINCFAPYINFRQLAPIDILVRPSLDLARSLLEAEPSSILAHLVKTTSDVELKETGDEILAYTPVDYHLKSLLVSYAPGACVGIYPYSPQDNENAEAPILLFLTKYYLDFNSGSVAIEAYMAVVTKYISHITLEELLPASDEAMKWWKGVLPSLVESAREWTHTPNCEYKTEGIPRKGPVPVCSCGKGKVGQDFKAMKKWEEFTSHVTKICIRPYFSAPWLSAQPRVVDDLGTRKQNTGTIAPTPAKTKPKTTAATTIPVTSPAPAKTTATTTVKTKVETATAATTTPTIHTTTNPTTKECRHCFKKDCMKKCGKCMSVWYCSRECQAKDWSEHKKVCGLEAGVDIH